MRGHISYAIGAGACAALTLSISGAKLGQIVVMNWTDTTPPVSLMLGPARVSSTDHVAMSFCNVGTAAISQSNAAIRLATFD